MKPIVLTPREIHIHADHRLVFQVMSAFGAGGLEDYSSKVLEDNGDRKLVEFHTPIKVRGKKHMVKSVEWVHLQEPGRIDFSLAYPNPEDKMFALDTLEDSFIITPHGDCTLFRYESKFAAKTPIIGWLAAHLMMKKVMSNHMDDHIQEIKQLCEARAERSRIYPQKPCTQTD